MGICSVSARRDVLTFTVVGAPAARERQNVSIQAATTASSLSGSTSNAASAIARSNASRVTCTPSSAGGSVLRIRAIVMTLPRGSTQQATNCLSAQSSTALQRSSIQDCPPRESV